MRKVLILIATVVVALMAGQAAAADQPVAMATPFIADQGDLWAAAISEQAVGTDRLVATAAPFISDQGDLWATVTYSFASLDIQNQWRAAGWPAFIDGVEVYVLASAVLPSNTPIYKAIPGASGNPVWAFAHTWTGTWSSTPGVYQPYLVVQPPPPHIAGQSGSRTVLIATKQYIDVLPESPMDSVGNVNYNYGVYIMFDPIDVQMNFPADGVLTLGTDGFFKFQGLMFFGRKLNGQLQLYNGG
jgi:opacity protein-like surface antigen